MKRQLTRNGFTIVELMIVVALIAIVLAFAAPALSSSRKAANQTSAVATLKSILSANLQFRLRRGRYAPTLEVLRDFAGHDSEGGDAKSGYTFTYTGGPRRWRCVARPTDPGTTGDLGFFISHRGVLRWAENPVTVDEDSTPLAERL